MNITHIVMMKFLTGATEASETVQRIGKSVAADSYDIGSQSADSHTATTAADSF